MKQYIGESKHGEIIFQEITAENTIRGFSLYDIVQLADGTDALTNSGWCHKVTLKNGKGYETGGKPAPKARKSKRLKNAYECDAVSYCSHCGQAHDMDQNDGSWVMGDCEIFCADCASAEDVAIEMTGPECLFKARDMREVEIPKTFTEIETLFCDSSGFGAPYEAALTKEQALLRTKEILSRPGLKKAKLVCGLTGIGQFQVYVTVWKVGGES